MARAGMTTTAATPNTTRMAVSVPDGAAASDTVSDVGSMYGHWATPHPTTIDATAPTASNRAPFDDPRTSRTREPTPHRAETITSGSARDVSPWKTYTASAWSTKMPTTATTPARTAVAMARRRK